MVLPWLRKAGKVRSGEEVHVFKKKLFPIVITFYLGVIKHLLMESSYEVKGFKMPKGHNLQGCTIVYQVRVVNRILSFNWLPMPQSEVLQNKSESVLVPVRLTFKVASSSIGVNQSHGLPSSWGSTVIIDIVWQFLKGLWSGIESHFFLGFSLLMQPLQGLLPILDDESKMA